MYSIRLTSASLWRRERRFLFQHEAVLRELCSQPFACFASIQRSSCRSIEPTGSSTDSFAQSQAFAILFLTSETAPRLKFPSFIFPSVLRVAFIDSLPLSERDWINAMASGANAARL